MVGLGEIEGVTVVEGRRNDGVYAKAPNRLKDALSKTEEDLRRRGEGDEDEERGEAEGDGVVERQQDEG